MLGASLAGFAYAYGSKTPFLISTIALIIALILSLIQYINRNKDNHIEKQLNIE